MGMTLWSFKCMGRLVVRLKAIKYNQDFSAIYLLRLSIRSSHLAICHQAAPSSLASPILFYIFSCLQAFPEVLLNESRYQILP